MLKIMNIAWCYLFFLSRRINPTYTSDNIPEALNQWTAYTSQMIEDCQHIGIHRCMTVRYECLVIKPKREIQKILSKIQLDHMLI